MDEDPPNDLDSFFYHLRGLATPMQVEPEILQSLSPALASSPPTASSAHRQRLESPKQMSGQYVTEATRLPTSSPLSSAPSTDSSVEGHDPGSPLISKYQARKSIGPHNQEHYVPSSSLIVLGRETMTTNSGADSRAMAPWSSRAEEAAAAVPEQSSTKIRL